MISTEIAGKLPEVVKIPQSNEELANARSLFYQVAHFPGVVGCVDCTHIPISSPGGELAEVYRNRKGYFSLNVQVNVKFDKNMIIYLINRTCTSDICFTLHLIGGCWSQAGDLGYCLSMAWVYTRC